jgi:hypothetical protein
MPHGSRSTLMFAFGVATMVASTPAWGQLTSPDVGSQDSLLGWSVPNDLLYQRPPPAPWSAAPAPQARLSPGGITQSQAMNLLAAEGFTDILPPNPTADGGWTGYASLRGKKVRAVVDLYGNISTK